MQASLPVAELSRALAGVRKAVRANPALLAYSGVHLQVAGKVLTVTATDGEITISSSLGVEDAKDGAALLSPKPLGEVLTRLPESAKVVLSSSSTELTLKGLSLPTYKFRLLEATFAKTPPPSGEQHSVNLEALSQGVAVVAASMQGASAPLVQMLSRDGDLVLNATDGFRLVHTVLPGVGFPAFQGVLSLPLLDTVASLKPDKVVVDPMGRTIGLSGPLASATLRLAATPFQPVDQVLAACPSASVLLPQEPLRKALQRLSAVADGAHVLCEASGKMLTLSTMNPDRGEGNELVELPAAVPSAVRFAVNPGFLSGSISAFSSEFLELGFVSPADPLFFTSSSPLRTVVVVMPVRLD